MPCANWRRRHSILGDFASDFDDNLAVVFGDGALLVAKVKPDVRSRMTVLKAEEEATAQRELLFDHL